MPKNQYVQILDPYGGIKSPISCVHLRIVCAVCVLMALTSVTFNSLLLVFFIKYKKLRTRLNVFVVAITILNLIGTFSEFSFILPSTYYCKYTLV